MLFIIFRFRQATAKINNVITGLDAAEYHEHAANVVNSSAEQLNVIWSSLQQFKKSNRSGRHQSRY